MAFTQVIKTLGSVMASMRTAVNSWLSQNITNPSNPPLDRSLSLSNACAPADLVGDLKNEIPLTYVALDGENQVEPQNISGVTFSKGSSEVEGPNIFTNDDLFEEDYYISINTTVTPNVIGHQSSSSYNSYCIPVDGSSKYTFTEARFAVLSKGNTIGSEAVGTLATYATEITTTGANYLFLSIAKTATNIEVHKITTVYEYSNFKMPDWSTIPQLNTRVSKLEYNVGENIFNQAELLYSGGYANIIDGKISQKIINVNYNAYLLPVDGVSTYHFTDCRFAFLVDSDKETAIGGLLENVTAVTATGASYICFSFNISTYSTSTYEIVGKISGLKTKYASVEGNISNSNSLRIDNAKTNLRKNERLVFNGDITSFNSLKIGWSISTVVATDSNQINTFLIDGTNISYYAKSTSTAVIVPHGLTITNNIQIIVEPSATATCLFTIISNGELFNHEFTNYARQNIGLPFVLSISSTLTNCKLSWTCKDVNKNIWIFGDSYLQYSPSRWTYYLHEYGYDDNVLLDGYAGETGANANVGYANLVKYGTPHFAIWTIGMNDGTDSGSDPSSDWVTRRDAFLLTCSQNEITPIFCTVPTVETLTGTVLSHEKKNEWIRSSGYRFIDFAKAVGAQSDGTWFSGMLSSDKIHPTEEGARALFGRALLDLPELMIDDFDY